MVGWGSNTCKMGEPAWLAGLGEAAVMEKLAGPARTAR